MLFGVISGLAAAFMQSASYVLSRAYITKHPGSLCLAVYSQLFMGLLSAVLLICTYPYLEYPSSPAFIGYAAAWAGSYVIAQCCLFAALKHVEASRISSLLGLKIIALAFLAVCFYGRDLGTLRWTAVILCAVSAFGMGFSGGRIPALSVLWVSLTVIIFAVCDISCAQVVLLMPGSSTLLNSVGAAAVCYLVLGIITLPVLYFVPRRKELFKDAAAYSLIWFSSIVILLAAISAIGVVYASIVQSARGLFSVLLGIGIAFFSSSNLESRAGLGVWIRRIIMAVLMMISMILYAVG